MALVVDEMHWLKKSGTQLYEALRNFSSCSRVKVITAYLLYYGNAVPHCPVTMDSESRHTWLMECDGIQDYDLNEVDPFHVCINCTNADHTHWYCKIKR